MLTLTSEYALRAMIYLTQHEDEWPVPGRIIAEGAHIPAKYLSKVLGDLVRCGVLNSSPGKRGGFRLRRSPKETFLFEALAPFEQFDRKRCPFGNQECSDENPCFAHTRWKNVLDVEQRFLRETTVHDVTQKTARRPRPGSKTGC